VAVSKSRASPDLKEYELPEFEQVLLALDLDAVEASSKTMDQTAV
jgi:hypothetical protein